MTVAHDFKLLHSYVLHPSKNYSPEAFINPNLLSIRVHDIVEYTRVVSINVHEGDEAQCLLSKVVEHMGAAPGLKRYGLCNRMPASVSKPSIQKNSKL